MQVPRRRRGRGPLLLLLSVVILGACYGAPAAVPVGAAPVASSPPVEEQPAGETQGPITYPPDNMWAFLATMPGLQRTSDTLAGAVDFADVVVVGRYVGVERGGTYGIDSTAVAMIDVDSVLKGTPNMEPDGLLRVEFVLVVGPGGYPEKEFADLERSIPKDPALLYLISWASFMDAWGEVPGWSTRVDLADRYKTIGGDGAMRVVNGRIEPPPYIDGWPAGLGGLELEEVKDQIRAAIHSAVPAAPAVP